MTVGIIVSQLYDVFWIYEKSTEYWKDEVENGFAQIILLLILFMVFYKFILAIVMWKASLNYPKFVRQQRELVGMR